MKTSFRKTRIERYAKQLAEEHDNAEAIAWNMLINNAVTSKTDANSLIVASFTAVSHDNLTHLHIDDDMYQFIDNLKIPALAEGESFNLPFERLRISTPRGGIDVVFGKNAFDTTQDFFRSQVPTFKMSGFDTKEKELIFAIDSDGEELVTRLTAKEITDVVQRESMNHSVSEIFAKCFNLSISETERLRSIETTKFLFKLSMLLSFKGEQSLFWTSSKIKKFKGEKIYQFKREILPPKGKNSFFVMPFMRQLRDPKYYQNQYAEYPVGTRYTMVSGHERQR